MISIRRHGKASSLARALAKRSVARSVARARWPKLSPREFSEFDYLLSLRILYQKLALWKGSSNDPRGPLTEVPTSIANHTQTTQCKKKPKKKTCNAMPKNRLFFKFCSPQPSSDSFPSSSPSCHLWPSSSWKNLLGEACA